ncbi:MAG: hypothetical protein K2N37_07690 [Lachnospiraceae bacterium]|nr:hypothetical protein [Lachnospiraceae bacterium]
MITLLFCILMFTVFGKLALVAIRAAWGISKVIFCLVLAPLFLIVLLISGLVYIALPLLLIGAVVSFAAAKV